MADTTPPTPPTPYHQDESVIVTAFFCGPNDVGIQTCWWCDGPVPPHVIDHRFCSHECAALHINEIGDGPCTVCGNQKGHHPIPNDPHPYFPFGADAHEVYEACGGSA